jgi:hypothetical protein
MVQYSSYCTDVLFFTDGKPWKMAKPGTGDAAAVHVHAARGGDVHLGQCSYYNGHYSFAGAKYNMSCKLIECATPSHAHYVDMMQWFYRNHLCLQFSLSFMLKMIL